MQSPFFEQECIVLITVDGKIIRHVIQRRQFPLTAAYAFTDYRSQGQTIIVLLVNIATPPTGGLSLFDLYVALSRSSGRDTIRQLRDFDDKVLQRSHNPNLIAEDNRVEELDEETLAWYRIVIKCRQT
jgi:ATP-dependent exoDNAse (exonuclease V) alpha subunit